MAPIFAEGSVDLHQSIRNWYDSLHVIALVYGDTKTHKANNTSRKIKLALHRAVPVSDLQSPILPFNVTLSVIFYHMLELPICLIQIVAVLSYILPCLLSYHTAFHRPVPLSYVPSPVQSSSFIPFLIASS